MKFNFLKNKKTEVRNHEGAKSFILTPEYELYSAVATTSLNNTFYESADGRLERIQSLIKKCPAEFVAKLAAYTRNSMYMRSIPLVLSVELAKQASGDNLVSKTVNSVVQRADEIAELLAYYQLANKRTGVKKLNKLSKQVQKGLKMAFNKFDEYQFAKYNTKADVRLQDALFLVHPKAKDEAQQNIFDKIASGNLDTPYTWETELSNLGKQCFDDEISKEQAFSKKWEELIDSKRLGYMALLRNLRNILQAKVSAGHVAAVCHFIADAKAVANSKQLPFRFLAAYREIKHLKSGHVSGLLDALEMAVSNSAMNIKGFGEDTSVVIACDVSGSMQKPVSPRSKILLYDIGLLLAMLLQSKCKNVITGMFGSTWKVINMSKNSVLSNVQEYYNRAGEVGYATNGYLVLEDLIQRKQVVDKVMMFTDVQMWNSTETKDDFFSSWTKYKLLAPKARLYLFDLAGYGHMPVDVKPNDVYLIAGWSDKVFDVLNALENVESALVNIKAIEL